MAVWLVLSLAMGSSAAASSLPRSMLVVQPSDLRGPFYYQVFAAFRSTVNANGGAPVSIYLESLDLSRFSGPEYDASLEQHLLVKYRNKPVGVLVAVGQAALEHVLRWRDEVWPGVPVVFAMADEAIVARLKTEPGVTGTISELSFRQMMTSAHAVVPNLAGIAIVGDRLETQSTFRGFIQQVKAAASELEVIDLTGLRMSELRKRVANLPDRTAILYTAIYSDGEGTYYPPSDAVALVAAVANRPVVVSFETFLGSGAVGGFVVVPSGLGEGAAHLALRVMDGEDPSTIPITAADIARPVFDWRQLQRWSVDESRLPPGSEVRYRAPNVWEQYRWTIASVVAVLTLQTALIVGLLHQRRARRRAELAARERASELAHMNRQATAGVLSASIAHELNQPLGAILNNSEAAIMMLESPSPDMEQIKEALDDIKRDDTRASEIILRLRRMLKKAEIQAQDIDLNDTVREVLALLSAEAASRNVVLNARLSTDVLRVSGDRIQLQQVILNLIVNAIETMAATANAQRQITSRTERIDGRWAEISIADSGPGIASDKLTRIFEPFFTTKEQGMGMGLSISRTIVEAHRGKLWAENQSQGGAIFRIRLPLAAARQSPNG